MAHSKKHKHDDGSFHCVLVTGGSGFIGSNYLNYAVKKYTNTTYVNLDCLNYCSSRKNNQEIANLKNYHFVEGKIQSKDLVSHILNEYNVDGVIHFAAQSHVDNSFESSLDFCNDNVLGTHILLECCRVYGKLKRFLHISTDEVYGESQFSDQERKSESNSILCPTNPYAATKAAAELIAMSYYYSHKLPVVISRGNNVYGPRQYYEKVVPRFIHLLRDGQKCTIHGDGSALRAFIHVEDVVSAVDIIMMQGKIAEIYNIGSPIEVSVMEVANMLIKLVKGPNANVKDWINTVEDRKFNDKRYFISDDKLKSLGWKGSTIEFADGLKTTVDWYVKNFENHWPERNHHG